MLTINIWDRLNTIGKVNMIIIYADDCLDLAEGEREKLCKNVNLIDAFIKEAHRIAKVRDHYSARTIIEVLRHHSLLSDSDATYKISNNIVPLLPRITTEMFPALNGLFKMKTRS